MDTTRIDEKIALFERLLNEPSAPWEAPLAQAEQVTGVARLRLLVVALLVLALCLQCLGFGSAVVSLVLCHTHAVYRTAELIASPAARGRPGADADAAARKWRTFWMASAALLLVEKHLWFVVYVVPCYTLAKTVFLLWCTAPVENNGCAYLLDHVLRPYLGHVGNVAAARRRGAGRKSAVAAVVTAADSRDDASADSLNGASADSLNGASADSLNDASADSLNDASADSRNDATADLPGDVTTADVPDVATADVPDVATAVAPDVATAVAPDVTAHTSSPNLSDLKTDKQQVQ